MINKNKKQDQAMGSAFKEEMVYEFVNGVPGFPELKKFYLSDLKDGSYPPLKVLMSLDNPEISFILYPHVNGSSLFDQETLYGFAKAYERTQKDLEIYSIVTIRRPDGNISLTTNLKAPLVLDKTENKGWQHIIPSRDADLMFPLDTLSRSFQAARGKTMAAPI